MKTYRISGQSRGTQILVDGADRAAFGLVGDLEVLAWRLGIARRAFLPSMVNAECYSGSPGQQMRVQGPSAETVLCPERTDQARRLFRETDCPSFYYIERCFRLERPQSGRLREFTQFGVEVRDPIPQMTGPYIDCVLGEIRKWCPSAVLVDGVERGSSYYSGAGFEIEVPELGAQKQVCGGGPYPEGWGFAIGIERLLLAMEKQ